MIERQANNTSNFERQVSRFARCGLPVIAAMVMIIIASPAFALEENVYRQFMGLDSRRLVWFLAQMHLFFGAFVLGVPLFAVIIEVVGWKNGDSKFDNLAYEFTSLLSVAYATTAALGGLLAFALFTLYPTFMGYMAGIFKDVMFMYALLFFGETFALYLYYYGWKWLKSGLPFPTHMRWVFKALSLALAAFGGAILFGLVGPEMRTDTRWFILLLYILPVVVGLWIIRDRKTVHIFIGILLNVFGTAIMQLANSWAGFMMSPTGVDGDGAFVGTSGRHLKIFWQLRLLSIACSATWHLAGLLRAPMRQLSSSAPRPRKNGPTMIGWATSRISSPLRH